MVNRHSNYSLHPTAFLFTSRGHKVYVVCFAYNLRIKLMLFVLCCSTFAINLHVRNKILFKTTE